jgi:tetratricopeptide (TPR) repeat protein
MRFLVPLVCLGLATPALAGQQLAPGAQQQIDKLMPKLAKAGSAENAKPIEGQLLSLFAQSGSPSVDLLMTRAAAALQAGDANTAHELVRDVTEIAPNYAEGWRHLGELAQAANNDTGAIAAYQKALTLNPHEFQASAELAGILADYGDKKQALQYFRKAQAIDPWLEGVGDSVTKLAREVEGEKI